MVRSPEQICIALSNTLQYPCNVVIYDNYTAKSVLIKL